MKIEIANGMYFLVAPPQYDKNNLKKVKGQDFSRVMQCEKIKWNKQDQNEYNLLKPKQNQSREEALIGELNEIYKLLRMINEGANSIALSALDNEAAEKRLERHILKSLKLFPNATIIASSEKSIQFWMDRATFDIEYEFYLFSRSNAIDSKQKAFYLAVFMLMEQMPGCTLEISAKRISKENNRKTGVQFILCDMQGNQITRFDEEFIISNNLIGASNDDIKTFMKNKHGSNSNMSINQFNDFIWDLARGNMLNKNMLNISINYESGIIRFDSLHKANEYKSQIFKALENASPSQRFDFARLFLLEYQNMINLISKGLKPPSDYKGYLAFYEFLSSF